MTTSSYFLLLYIVSCALQDMDFVKFIITCFTNYFPNTLGKDTNTTFGLINRGNEIISMSKLIFVLFCSLKLGYWLWSCHGYCQVLNLFKYVKLSLYPQLTCLTSLICLGCMDVLNMSWHMSKIEKSSSIDLLGILLFFIPDHYYSDSLSESHIHVCLLVCNEAKRDNQANMLIYFSIVLAAWKIVKTWLSPEAVNKIKYVSRFMYSRTTIAYKLIKTDP